MRAATYLLGSGLLLAAVPAGAQVVDTASQRIELAGDAPPACVLSEPVASAAVNAVYAGGSASTGQVSISQLVDPTTALPRESAIVLTFPAACNASHTISVRSGNGGLLRAGGQPVGATAGGFGEFLTYDLGVDWAGGTAVQSSNAGALDIVNPRPNAGSLVLRVNTPSSEVPLAAGQYSDSIVVVVQTSN
jgi:hypothetical protein